MRTKSLYRLISALAIAGGLCFAGPAFAVPVPELEPNNSATPAGSQLLGTLVTTLEVDPGFILDSTFNPLDLDVFQFVLAVPSLIQLSTDPGESGFDGLLSLLDDEGVPLLDSAMLGGDSSIPFHLRPAGTYYAMIEGDVVEVVDGDDGDGGTPIFITIHNNGDYTLLIERIAVPTNGAPVPEPASLLLLGSGLAGLALWRRKRA